VIVEGVTCAYNGIPVFPPLSFEAADEFICVVGESGIGKTTLLKCLLGEIAFEGKIVIKGKLSYIPQSDQLVPWLTVEQNIRLGNRRTDVEELLKLVKMDPTKRYALPRSLSGGQIQRVALATTIASGSDIILCDEPFSALDYINRESLQDLIKELFKGKTVIFVTHNVYEAAYLANRVLVLQSDDYCELSISNGNDRSSREFFDAVTQIRASFTNFLCQPMPAEKERDWIESG